MSATVLASLNAGLQRAFAADPTVLLLGEDILDPYGGAFKVTRGLAAAYPERVLTTPISEAGIVGVAAGMALRGLRPVVEIMFGDFVTLAADALLNHAAKFPRMFGQPLSVPLVVRTPMGGRRGYGPTHSQTLEKLFLGAPGLEVYAPCAWGDPGDLLAQLILHTQTPLLFVENKLQYLLATGLGAPAADFQLEALAPRVAALPAPAYRLTVAAAPPPTLTVAAYGYMAELAAQAVRRAAYEQEIFCEVLAVTRLSPLDWEPLAASAARTGRLLTVEEGPLEAGWGAEVVARLSTELGPRLQASARLAAAPEPIPASPPLEARALPGIEAIFQAIRSLAAH
jgi:pyruvate/2-oxoglutarate/acetoin dehydrogenase E1 component